MVSSNSIRLALVGYGRIAIKHISVFQNIDCNIIAACNRSEEGRNNAKNEGFIKNTYSNIKEMIHKETPDGIICCASFDQIYNVAKEIIPYKIPILLEKPPGTSFNEFEELIDDSLKYNTPVVVGLNRRHYSIINKAIEDAGGFEKITSVFIDWSENPDHFLKRGFSFAQTSKMIFGNSLHGLDLLTYLSGNIVKPNVNVINIGKPFRWIMSLQGISDRNVLATFQSTWDSPGRWRLSFCTCDRRYTFEPLETCIVSHKGLKNRNIEPENYDLNFKPGFYNQAIIFKKTIISGKAPDQYNLVSAKPSMKLAEILTNVFVK